MKSLKSIFFAVTISIAVSISAQVKPTIAWINLMNSDSTINSVSSDIDASSKVYVAGRISPSTSDMKVQCIDSSGIVLWTYTYDNGAFDSPVKLRIDASGNTYVTGISQHTVSKRDYYTFKLNTSGSLVWSYRYDGGSNGMDEPSAMCLDNSGNVYVTGKSRQGSYWQARTIKINSSGSLVWQHTFSGSGFDDEGICLTLSNGQNDLVIAGNSSNGSDNDIIVYMLSASTGTVGWSQTITGTNSNEDFAKAIALSLDGHILVAGMTDNTSTNQDYSLIKLNKASGAIKFHNKYDFSGADIASSLIVDATGNIAVTGYVYNYSNSDFEYHTKLYDSTGASIWLNRKLVNCSSINVEPVIVRDTIANHFYVCGEKRNSSVDILVYQLTPGGNLSWEKIYDAPVGLTDVGTSLVVNGLGEIFVAGNTTNGSSMFNNTTIKISQTPVYFPIDYGTPELNDPNFVFQENLGQLLHPNGIPVGTDTVSFYNHGSSPACYFNKSTISRVLFDRDTVPDSLVRVDLKILNANQFAEMYHYEPVEARKHYFNASSKGITDVRSYGRLFVPEIIPNVDVHHYSNTSGLKSYFVFKTAGESLNMLNFRIDGADSTKIDGSGNLIAYTELGNINMGLPTAYQATFNPSTPTVPVLVPLTVNWQSIGTDVYRFSISGASAFWPVVVYVSQPGAKSPPAAAPIGNLYWSTFLGEVGQDYILNNNVDSRNNYYAVGRTQSGNFPLSSGGYLQPIGFSAGFLGFVSKFDNQGVLKFSSYVGGINSACGGVLNQVWDIAIDSSFQIYMVGRTTATNMVTQPAGVSPSLFYVSNSSSSTGGCQTGFYMKLNPTGNVLQNGSYFGGTGQDELKTIKYSDGQIHVGGAYLLSSYPTYTSQANSFTLSTGSGAYLHLDTSGLIKHSTRVKYQVADLDIDNNGNCYLVSTSSSSTTTPIYGPAGTFYTSGYSGGNDWYIQRFSANDSLTWSTYFGGSANDFVETIYIRDSVMAIVGHGGSYDFPIYKTVSDSGDVAPISGDDVQIAKFDIKSGQQLWCAYHSGSYNAFVEGLVIDENYNLYVGGSGVGSGNIRPLSAGGFYQQNGAMNLDGFLLGFSSQNQRKWTTYFGSQVALPGGDEKDAFLRLAISNNGHLFASGHCKVENNSLPLVQWNNLCYFDNHLADSLERNWDGMIAMFIVADLNAVGIEEISRSPANSNYLLYPNPNSGKFSIRTNQSPNEKVSVIVLNLMGQIVYQNTDQKIINGELNLDLPQLESGVYLIKLNDYNGISTSKFTIGR